MNKPVNKPRYGYVLFYTGAAAFRAERLCAGAGMSGTRLVPTPRELSSDCGSSLRFTIADTVASDVVATAASGLIQEHDAGGLEAVPVSERMARLLQSNAVPYDRIELV